MNEDRSAVLVSFYTVIVFVLAGLALTMVASHQMLLELMEEDGGRVIVVLFRFLQTIEVIYFVLGIVVGVLRVYQSRLALPATAAFSILLVVWPPFGTAAFLYWVFNVRRRERPPIDGVEDTARVRSEL